MVMGCFWLTEAYNTQDKCLMLQQPLVSLEVKLSMYVSLQSHIHLLVNILGLQCLPRLRV